jgi:hypothetical protein
VSMDEPAWLASARPGPLLACAWGRSGRRKCRLFACGCCRSVWRRLTDPRSRVAVEAVERHADGQIGGEEFRRIAAGAGAAFDELKRAALAPVVGDELAGRALHESRGLFTLTDPEAARQAHDGASGDPAVCAALAVWSAATDTDELRPPATLLDALAFAAEQCAAAAEDPSAEEATQAKLAREVFGNPFRPVGVDPAWLTPPVVSLARQAYDTGDFAALPVLGDALEEAGCADEAVLGHCRGAGPHARGCWVVDLVLGKL